MDSNGAAQSEIGRSVRAVRDPVGLQSPSPTLNLTRASVILVLAAVPSSDIVRIPRTLQEIRINRRYPYCAAYGRGTLSST